MKIIKSKIISLNRKDIDTDLIIPADFLKITTKDGLGKHVFERLRSMDPAFPFNLPKYRGAKILVTGENFGCGSSREHAAWALRDWGIRVVIAPSFADIFFNNSMKNGILPIKLSTEVIDKIFSEELASGNYVIEVDLPNQRVILNDEEVHEFQIDSYRKECLIKEIDDMDYLIDNIDAIKKYDKKHSQHIFFDTTKI